MSCPLALTALTVPWAGAPRVAKVSGRPAYSVQVSATVSGCPNGVLDVTGWQVGAGTGVMSTIGAVARLARLVVP
ncbi:MAG: hypothetical protein ABSH51_29690 [Solirubrobacteraceae bacterium]